MLVYVCAFDSITYCIYLYFTNTDISMTIAKRFAAVSVIKGGDQSAISQIGIFPYRNRSARFPFRYPRASTLHYVWRLRQDDIVIEHRANTTLSLPRVGRQREPRGACSRHDLPIRWTHNAPSD